MENTFFNLTLLNLIISKQLDSNLSNYTKLSRSLFYKFISADEIKKYYNENSAVKIVELYRSTPT